MISCSWLEFAKRKLGAMMLGTHVPSGKWRELGRWAKDALHEATRPAPEEKSEDQQGHGEESEAEVQSAEKSDRTSLGSGGKSGAEMVGDRVLEEVS